MENENRETQETESLVGSFALLSLASQEKILTIRDDLYELPWLLDAVKASRRNSGRFRLIDSGRFDTIQLASLLAAGAQWYTSDIVRHDIEEIDEIRRFGRKARASYFCHEDLNAGEDSGQMAFQDYLALAGRGFSFYLSNREKERDWAQMTELASTCKKNHAWMVYYHHGPLDPAMVELAGRKTWIHLADPKPESEDRELFFRVVKAARSAGSNLILYLQEELDLGFITLCLKAGVHVHFKSAFFDYRSPFRPLVEKAGKKKLRGGAYYLYPNILL